jgi:hypothetical protein
MTTSLWPSTTPANRDRWKVKGETDWRRGYLELGQEKDVVRPMLRGDWRGDVERSAGCSAEQSFDFKRFCR